MPVDAAVGQKSVFGRAIERLNLGLPLGAMQFLNFEQVDLARTSELNPSVAITGSGGADQGTPGFIKTEKKLKYDLTVARIIVDLAGMCGAPVVTNLTGAWLVKFRPDTANAVRSISTYLHEGGSYTPSVSFGRRVAQISLADAANKRVQADITMTEPTGDTIAGFVVKGPANTGTITAAQLLQIGTRGRRPYDSNFTSSKSAYLKVTAFNTTSVTVVMKYDTPSGGGAFPAGAYGATTFVIPRPAAATGADGWATMLDSNTTPSGLAVGLFGENYEPFEVTFGDQDLSAGALVVNDQFEFPVAIAQLAKTTVAENRLSSFHLVRLIGATLDQRFDSGTTKFDRPFKEYYGNGRRLPSNVDPTGDVVAELVFKKRLFDRFYRQQNDGNLRFSVQSTYKLSSVIGATAFFETVDIWIPQGAVKTLKSGDIQNKNMLEETITLTAEQPSTSPTPPTGFDNLYPWEINVTTPVDPTPYV